MLIFLKKIQTIKKILISYLFYCNTIKPINFKKTYKINPYIDFSPFKIIKILNIKVLGVIQVGAHYGQEIDEIKKINKHLKFIVYEPSAKSLKILKKKYNKNLTVRIIGKALGSKKKSKINLWKASNDGQSSSLLEPKDHLIHVPNVKFYGVEKVRMDKLDSLKTNRKEYNFLIIDTQGYELEVLKGATQSLKYIDYIFVEINRAEVYENCAKFSDLNNFLNNHKFHCSHIRWWDFWGDAFYVKDHSK